MAKLYPRSKVDTKGFVALHYDALLDFFTLGRYSSFIKKAILLMEIRPSDRIIDLGTGTGRNVCLMMKHLSSGGDVMGLDIGEEMIAQFKKKCANFPNAKIAKLRIDRSLPFEEEFDKAFISFVLHGFPQNVREVIIGNAFEALKGSGEFFILDYNEFSLREMPFYLRLPFKLIECPYAFDFIGRNLKKMLAKSGFDGFEERFFFAKYIRLLKATKVT